MTEPTEDKWPPDAVFAAEEIPEPRPPEPRQLPKALGLTLGFLASVIGLPILLCGGYLCLRVPSSPSSHPVTGKARVTVDVPKIDDGLKSRELYMQADHAIYFDRDFERGRQLLAEASRLGGEYGKKADQLTRHLDWATDRSGIAAEIIAGNAPATEMDGVHITLLGVRSRTIEEVRLLPRPEREAIVRAVAEAARPDVVTYTIIDKYILPGIKRSLDIRLNRKVSKDDLAAIAMKLKNADPNTYDRTFICYYLPDMQVNTVAWATTHFNPDLEVRILGITAEQEEALKQQATDPSRDIIGTWIDERPFGAGRITIFRKDSRLFMENKYKDGSAGTWELVETPSQHGRRFDVNPDRGHGEYYLINSKGELQQLDPDGPFMTATKFN